MDKKNTPYEKTVSVKLNAGGKVVFPGPEHPGGNVVMHNPKHAQGIDIDKITFELTPDSVQGARIVGVTFPGQNIGNTFGAKNSDGFYGKESHDGKQLELPDDNRVEEGQEKFQYYVHIKDEKGRVHVADPQILNDPPPK